MDYSAVVQTAIGILVRGGYNGVQMLFRKHLPSQSRVFENRAGPG
jgi:hypothetical protein